MSAENAPLLNDSCPLDISDDDVIDAMKSLGGYIDITPSDFKEIYQLAFNHAFSRLNQSRTAEDVMSRRVFSVAGDTPLANIAADHNRVEGDRR